MSPALSKGLWIGGTAQCGHGPELPVYSPSTGHIIARLQSADRQDVTMAVDEAAQAFQDGRWRNIPVLARQRLLMNIGTLLRSHDQELATMIAEEMGMPEMAARFIEVPLAAAVFEYYAGLTVSMHGETLPIDIPGAPPEYLAYTLRQPIGVAGLITPWNFPLLLPSWKLAPALAAGCSVVLKPAPETPLVALRLAALLQEAGVPDGVVNVISGYDDAGKELVMDARVAKISLTGETATGRQVLQAAAPHIKRVSLELGGKSPSIVFADCDLEQAISQCLFGIYFNSGQVCQAGSRILVQQAIYNDFLDQFAQRTRDLRVGPATDPTTDVGPLVRADRVSRMDHYVQKAVAAGARVIVGGASLPGPGYFYAPTVIADVRPPMALAREEVFGPIAAVMPFQDEPDALQLANDTIYGLAAAIFTRDLRRGLRFARDVQAGTVWLNTSQVLSPTAPFGGFKQSGLGRELGQQGLDAFLETKTVIVDLNEIPMTYF